MISITLILVGITVIISLQAMNNPAMKQKLIHSPYAEQRTGEYHRLLTSGFIHADFMHLFINMFVLWQFGDQVEKMFILQFGTLMGRINYLLLYLVGIVIADLPSYYKHKDNPYYAALGASGAVSAIMFSYILFWPWSTLLLYGIIPIPGIVGALLYLGYSHWAAKNARDNIGHDAHFYGAVFGFFFTIALHPAWAGEFITNLMNFSF